jgi:monoamine oxidase
MQTEILIIGAGAAGLAAAVELSRAGRSVVVLEARERIGGRILTQADSAPNHPIELGAEFIHGKSPVLFSIVEQAKLKVSEVTSGNWYYDRGVFVKSSELWSSVENVMDRMKAEIQDVSFKGFVNSLPAEEVSDKAKKLALRFVEGFHAADVNKAGIHGLIAIDEDEEQRGGDQTFRLSNGYRDIVYYLFEQAEAHGVKFLLNTEAAEVSWQQQRVELRTTADQTIAATKAIVTIPLSLLKLRPPAQGAINFVPSLPAQKLEAIKALGMGPALRIVFLFNDEFWQDMRLAGDPNQDLKHIGFLNYPDAPLPTWWTTLPDDDPMMVGWAGGPTAARLLGLGADEIEARAVSSLALILGVDDHVVRDYLLATYFHNWLTDPFSKGAYAYLPVNGVEHQLTLAKPVANTLFFAGEATSLGEIGTVHGAINSGQRAAREILATDPAPLSKLKE